MADCGPRHLAFVFILMAPKLSVILNFSAQGNMALEMSRSLTESMFVAIGENKLNNFRSKSDHPIPTHRFRSGLYLYYRPIVTVTWTYRHFYGN